MLVYVCGEIYIRVHIMLYIYCSVYTFAKYLHGRLFLGELGSGFQETTAGTVAVMLPDVDLPPREE